jgi:arginase family enzyme
LRAATERATLVGLDVVEVSPPFDNGDITTFAALKLIFELWGMSWHSRRTSQQSSEGHGNR